MITTLSIKAYRKLKSDGDKHSVCGGLSIENLNNYSGSGNKKIMKPEPIDLEEEYDDDLDINLFDFSLEQADIAIFMPDDYLDPSKEKLNRMMKKAVLNVSGGKRDNMWKLHQGLTDFLIRLRHLHRRQSIFQLKKLWPKR